MRRRRRPSDSSADTNQISSLPNPTESTELHIRDDSENTPALLEVTNSYSPIGTNDINAIRASFIEDIYYAIALLSPITLTTPMIGVGIANTEVMITGIFWEDLNNSHFEAIALRALALANRQFQF